ncbi:ATP-binding cassette, sub-B (MDR TAP), member 4 [Podila epigama]|nr:ATP-binding cassette, sub-B (MDR TAP), member 4 [Podila epigama]
MATAHNDKQEFEEKIEPASHVVDMNDVTATPSAENLTEKENVETTPAVVAKSDDKPKKTKKSRWSKKSKDDKANDADKVEEEPAKSVSYFQLYRFASSWDWICVVLGSICALINGIGQPMVALLMGNVVTVLTNHQRDEKDAIPEIRILVIKFTVIGAIAFVAAYGQMCFWTMSAENQSKRIREKYLHAILRQDISWHDTGKKHESLNSRLSADTQLIFDGLADKVGMVLMSFACFVAGFAIAFSSGWRMSLVLLTSVPLMAICGALMAKYAMSQTAEGQGSYAKAGALAEQAISSIRTVTAFDGQKRELQKFSVQLDDAYKNGVKKAWATGIGMGSFMLIMFLSYSLAFWYGSRQVKEGKMDSGDVLTVLFGVIIGAFSLGNIGPNIAAFGKAQAAAYSIFETIDRVPVIDSSSPHGAKPENLKGHIIVRDVDFTYPSRPDVPILKKLNIEVLPGQTVALVGHSGSGKSTIVGLVERFYDPSSGSITLDGTEIRDFNVRYLRDNIGLVSQEPVLFNATIKQNILYGTRKDQPTPTDKEIEDACKLSNAHEFISKLPDKYNTMVGEKGALLSGGQKQRIAIARALIKNPSPPRPLIPSLRELYRLPWTMLLLDAQLL